MIRVISYCGTACESNAFNCNNYFFKVHKTKVGYLETLMNYIWVIIDVYYDLSGLKTGVSLWYKIYVFNVSI